MRIPPKTIIPFLAFFSICIGTSHGAVTARPGSPVLIAPNADGLYYGDLGLLPPSANNISAGYLRNFNNGGGFFTWINGQVGSTYYQNSSVPPGGPDIPFPALNPTNTQVNFSTNPSAPTNGSAFGEENWIAFSNGTEAGWIGFDLGVDGFITQINYFLYDPERPAGFPLSEAIKYSTGVDPMASAIPEFSSGMALGVLFMIGGCSYRRRAAKR